MNPFLLFIVAALVICGQVSVYAQRNDPTKNTIKKERTEKEGLSYEDAINRYGPPDKEMKMKNGSLVCTWLQTLGLQGDESGGLTGGTTMKMVIFFDKDGAMTDRKFRNCPIFFPDRVFRLDR